MWVDKVCVCVCAWPSAVQAETLSILIIQVSKKEWMDGSSFQLQNIDDSWHEPLPDQWPKRGSNNLSADTLRSYYLEAKAGGPQIQDQMWATQLVTGRPELPSKRYKLNRKWDLTRLLQWLWLAHIYLRYSKTSEQTMPRGVTMGWTRDKGLRSTGY